MGVRVTLTTLAVAAIAVVAAATSGGAPQRLSATAFTGTYAVSPLPGTTATLPWTNGGTLQISASSKSEVEGLGFRSTSSDQSCFAREEFPDEPPPRSVVFYVAHYSWKGGGTLGGCVSSKTGGTLVAARGRVVFQFGRTAGGGFAGCWGDDSRGCLGFAAQRGAGSSPPAGGTPKAGRTRTVAPPAPGKSAEVTSPQDLPQCPEGFRLPSSARAICNADVNVTAAPTDLKQTTLVGEGEVVATKVGEAVTSCWLVGPDSLNVNSAVVKKIIGDSRFKQRFDSFTASEALDACMYIVLLEANFATAKPGWRMPSAIAAPSAVCKVRQFAIAVRVRGRRLYPQAPAKPSSAGAIRYACTTTTTGLKIKVSARSGGLRKALGKKLDLGVVRTPKAPKATGKLAFRFAW